MMPGNVRPPVALLTDEDARELLARPLLSLCQEHGPTRVGKALGGVDEKTIRNARDEKSLLGVDTAANMLALDPYALDGLLNHFGRRSVAIEAKCEGDALPSLTGAVHRLVTAASPASPGGAGITDCELLGAEGEVRAAYDALGALLHRIERGRRRPANG